MTLPATKAQAGRPVGPLCFPYYHSALLWGFRRRQHLQLASPSPDIIHTPFIYLTLPIPSSATIATIGVVIEGKPLRFHSFRSDRFDHLSSDSSEAIQSNCNLTSLSFPPSRFIHSIAKERTNGPTFSV